MKSINAHYHAILYDEARVRYLGRGTKKRRLYMNVSWGLIAWAQGF